MVTKRSASGYGETVARLTKAIESRGLTVFTRIDHAVAAREAGLDLADEQVVLFGNPRAGTPLMQSDPRIGIELPLRVLVWADADGVLLGYLDPRELGAATTSPRSITRSWSRWRRWSASSRLRRPASPGGHTRYGSAS